MSAIVHDLSDSALLAANHANLVELYHFLGQVPPGEAHDGPEVSWAITGVPDAEFNTVTRARFAPGVDASDLDAAIARTLARFSARQVPVTWFVGPDAQPADLGTRLERHGLMYAGARPAMGADLLAPRAEPVAPDGLTITEAVDPEAVGLWARTAVRGFGMPGAIEDPVAALYMRLPAGPDSPARYHVACLDARPVATSSLFLGAGVAGIYAVATLPEARRQGIGAATVLASMRTAQALGFHVAILQASPMGYPVYQELGFRENGKLHTYTGNTAG
jgi:GNAT superfamily N-acetyltransferase